MIRGTLEAGATLSKRRGSFQTPPKGATAHSTSKVVTRLALEAAGHRRCVGAVQVKISSLGLWSACGRDVPTGFFGLSLCPRSFYPLNAVFVPGRCASGE